MKSREVMVTLITFFYISYLVLIVFHLLFLDVLLFYLPKCQERKEKDKRLISDKGAKEIKEWNNNGIVANNKTLLNPYGIDTLLVFYGFLFQPNNAHTISFVCLTKSGTDATH